MFRILLRRICSQIKIPMARPNEPDMLPKHIKKVPLFTVPNFSPVKEIL